MHIGGLEYNIDYLYIYLQREILLLQEQTFKCCPRILPINYPFKDTVNSGQAIYQMDLHAINVMYELWTKQRRGP